MNTDYTYDALSRLLSVLHKLGGNTIDGATYTVDNVGNRTAKTNHLPGAPVESYTYDPIYQLTQVVQNGSTTTESYTYDGVGNRLSSLGISPYAYNSSNQLTSRPNETYTYDNNGNTTSKTDASGTTTYTWGYENRLTQVTLPGSGGTVSFTYDPFGRRVRKITPTTTTVFAYDGANFIEETDSSGNAVARYSQGLNIDEPLAMLRSSVTHFYSADGLGSITSLTDAAGSVYATYTYDTFGNLAASTGTVTSPFRYTAREWDAETGFYYYRARYYGPVPGRFQTEDPIRFKGGANFYAYVANNPTSSVDPLGLLRDCGQENIECFRRCWNQPCIPWPWSKMGRDARYRYCEAKCQDEFMECEEDNERERRREKIRRELRRVKEFCKSYPVVCVAVPLLVITIAVQPELAPVLAPAL